MNFHQESLRRSVRTAIFLPLIAALAYCKRPEQDLGLNLQPDGDLLNVLFTDTFTLRAFTVTEDSLRSDELRQSVLGNTVDPETGLIMASFYTQVRLSAPDIDFGPNPVCDSIVLALKYAGPFWGRTTPQSFAVFELDESIRQEDNYFTSRDFDVKAENLVRPGTGLLAIKPTRRLFIAGDSVSPQLRIPLALSLGERLLTADPSVYANNINWLEYFKGIYVVSGSTDGAALNFDLVDVESRIRMYYHNDLDTTFYDLNISSLSARSNRFKQVFGNNLAGLNPESEIDGSARTWIQGGASVKTRVEIPFLNELNRFSRRVINKAELILPVSGPTDPRFPNMPQLFVLTETADGQAVGLPGQLSTTIDIGGSYEPSANRYRFNITRWVQEYLNGNQAVSFLHVVSGNAGISVQRTVLNGPEADVEDPERKMRLLITYTH